MKARILFGLIFVTIIAVFIFTFVRKSDGGETAIPQKPLHWHPVISIFINGERQIIPKDIGISIGKNIDNDISGMRMSPTHTHEDDGTIHLENNRPWIKPETLTLGYFFKVWDKNFNNSCIFEYCNDSTSQLTMTVNGRPNYEFDKYRMHDKDFIVIEYK